MGCDAVDTRSLELQNAFSEIAAMHVKLQQQQVNLMKESVLGRRCAEAAVHCTRLTALAHCLQREIQDLQAQDMVQQTDLRAWKKAAKSNHKRAQQLLLEAERSIALAAEVHRLRALLQTARRDLHNAVRRTNPEYQTSVRCAALEIEVEHLKQQLLRQSSLADHLPLQLQAQNDQLRPQSQKNLQQLQQTMSCQRYGATASDWIENVASTVTAVAAVEQVRRLTLCMAACWLRLMHQQVFGPRVSN